MKVVGLCGGSGSGKGTVAKMFSSYGIPSIDTDAVYHTLTGGRSPCTDALAKEFGSEILREDGSLDRKKLAAIVFSGEDKDKKRAALNSISHKFVLDETRRMLAEYERGGASAALVDAPLLFESGFDRECDLIIAVTADKSVRVSRIISRDGISEDAALARISVQLPDEYLLERADFVIDNSGALSDTERAVKNISNELIK